MDEHRIVELLTRKIAGEASPDELGELSYLLTKYPDAVYYEALLEQVWDLDEKDDKANLGETYKNHKLKFKGELNFEIRSRAMISYVKKPVYIMTTLACVVFFISAYFLIFYQSVDKHERIEIIAGKGIRKEIKLPDGTLVRLNSDSKISYDIDMQNSDQRDVSLIGEAFFKVAHDKERPFVVKTSKIAIKVLGTEFNVKEYPGDQESETTLLKGSIELTVNGRSDQKFVLKPSEKFALVEKNKNLADRNRNLADKNSSSVLMIENITPVKLGDQEYIQETSWIENKLVFQNESFEDLLPKLERWYNVRIIMEDSTIKSYRFTGIFINENINQALKAMQLIKSFHYKLNENEVRIY